MYNEIGWKIKTLARLMFIVGAILSIIVGLFISGNNESTGTLIVIIGPLNAFVLSLLVYGFGEIIEKICDIEINTRGEKRILKAREELWLLKEKLDLDMITEEEYQAQRAEIISKI